MIAPLLVPVLGLALAAHAEVGAPRVRADAPDRARQPAAGPEKELALPSIRQFEVRGIKGYLVERPGLPIV